MAIKYFKSGLLLLVALTTLSARCNKETTRPCYSAAPYAFDVTSEWTPQKEVYHIGDTIYLNMSFPKTLTDLLSSKEVSYQDAVGISGPILTGQLDSQEIIPAMSNFDYIPVTGTFQNIKNTPEIGKVIFVDEQFTSYKFKVAILLKTKGIYLFYVSDLRSEGLKGKDCTNAVFNMLVTNSDKHISLFQQALNQIPDSVQQRTMYCFKVE